MSIPSSIPPACAVRSCLRAFVHTSVLVLCGALASLPSAVPIAQAADADDQVGCETRVARAFSQFVKATLRCRRRAELAASRGRSRDLSACTQAVRAKFDAAVDAIADGCTGHCSLGVTAAMADEAADWIDESADRIYCEAEPIRIVSQELEAPATCGGPGYSTPAVPPFSGEVLDAGGTKLADLQLGCVYTGGAAPGQPGGGAPIFVDSLGTGVGFIEAQPGEGTQVTFEPSDEPGPLGCSRGAGPRRHCLGNTATGAECTDDAQCGGTAGSCQPDARCYTTPPLPLSSADGIPTEVCLVNIVQDDMTGTLDLATGEGSWSMPLATRVYLSRCPRCVAGTCNAGKRFQQACTANVEAATTIDCLPSDSLYFGVIETPFLRTTGETSLTSDAAGAFCAGQPHPGAFGLADAREIVQRGMPAGDLRDGEPHELIGTMTACIPPSLNPLINQGGGLPFPITVASRVILQLQ
jgi:hypothetical protein